MNNETHSNDIRPTTTSSKINNEVPLYPKGMVIGKYLVFGGVMGGIFIVLVGFIVT